MRNVSISRKFMLMMGMFGVCTLIQIAYTAAHLNSLARTYNTMLKADAGGALQLAKANHALQEMRSATADVMMSRTSDMNTLASDEFAKAQEAFGTAIEQAGQLLPERQADLTAIKSDVQSTLDEACNHVVEIALQSNSEANAAGSQAVFLKECQPRINALGPRLSALTAEVADAVESTGQVLEQDAGKVAFQTLVFAVLSLIGALLGSLLLVRIWVVRPVGKLCAEMDRLVHGDLGIMVSGLDRGDELGRMARAVQVFKETGIKASELEVQAEESRTRAAAEQEEVRRREAIFTQQMQDATQGLAEGLRHLAAGDLTFTIDTAFAETFEPVRHDFNATIDNLRSTVGQITAAVDLIERRVRELGAGAVELSSRSERQAASLEESASSLRDLTANVQQSAARTEEARRFAADSNTAAQQSNEVVRIAMHSIGQIEKSSNEIANIVGVIDDIAYQTNLLALNAGVEAARAGDSGKGFAVVAHEIRELAQRSSLAASDIKQLIETSVGEIRLGVRHVGVAGQSLQAISTQVLLINQELDALARTALEQSSSLREVNTAIVQIDEATQKNTMMVEASSGATRELVDEADRLRGLVDRFRLVADQRSGPRYEQGAA